MRILQADKEDIPIGSRGDRINAFPELDIQAIAGDDEDAYSKWV